MNAGELPIPMIHIQTHDEVASMEQSSYQAAVGQLAGTDIGPAGVMSGLHARCRSPESPTVAPPPARRLSVGRGTNYNFLTPHGDASPTHDTFDGREAAYHDLQPLHGRHRGEERGGVFDSTVTYLSLDERQPYRISVDGKGCILDAEGRLFDTREAALRPGKPAERAIYVMDQYGEIYASNAPKKGKFHHSSFLSGHRVAAAGDLRVVDGHVTHVSRTSGHYQPTSAQLEQLINQLDKLGVRRTYEIEDDDTSES